jgi:hypothetical protein
VELLLISADLIGLPLGPCCTFTVIVIFLVLIPFDAACVAASDVV